MFCDMLKVSACGTYMAVCTTTRMESDYREVLIYETEGYQILSRLSGGSKCRKAEIQWSPDASQLSIFTFTPTPEAIIIDAPTGQVLWSLSLETMKFADVFVGQEHLKRGTAFAAWAPSGRKLLRSHQNRERDGELVYEGELRIYDMLADTLVAVSAYTAQGSPSWPPAFWHPSSQGLVLNSCTELHDASALHQAHVAVARLPAACDMEHNGEQGFSSDGEYYLAPCWIEHGMGGHAGMLLLRCCLQGGHMSLTPLRELEVGFAHWLPQSHVAIMSESEEGDQDTRYAKNVVDDTFCYDCGHLPSGHAESLLWSPFSFSPSHGQVSSSGAPQVRCLKTGLQLWTLENSGDECYFSMAWLPSGHSLVYVKSEDEPDSERGFLHVFTFS